MIEVSVINEREGTERFRAVVIDQWDSEEDCNMQTNRSGIMMAALSGLLALDADRAARPHELRIMAGEDVGLSRATRRLLNLPGHGLGGAGIGVLQPRSTTRKAWRIRMKQNRSRRPSQRRN